MSKKKNETQWDYQEPPSGTLDRFGLVAYLDRNKIILSTLLGLQAQIDGAT